MTDDTTTAPDVEGEILAVRQMRAVAANVRAELARQDKGPVFVADVLRLHRNTVRRRLTGEAPFAFHEVAILAAELHVPIAKFADGL